MIRSSASLFRPTFTFFIVMATLVVILLLRSGGSADIKDTFEIDANHCDDPLPCTPAEAKAGYYAGIEQNEDDWATATAIPATNGVNNGLADCQAPTAPGGATPVFLSCNSDRADVPTCYGSRVVENPASLGAATFICDGNAGGTLQAELDIVSSFTGCSEQKTNDFRWCVNTTGTLNNPAKSDETHGYTVINRPVVCDAASGSDAGEEHNFLLGGYERLGNEGTVFAGFVFAQESPLVITHPSGDKSVNFVDPTDSTVHYRNVGDVLVLLNQSGNNVIMQFSVAVDHDSNPATVPVFGPAQTAPVSAGNCGSLAVVNPKLSGADSANVGILSPPWLGEFCDDVVDPTQDDTNDLVGTTNNQCKIIGNVPVGSCTGVPDASSQSLPNCQPGGNLVPPTDFVEFALDLSAAGIATDVCSLQTVLMTSRSSDEFTADLKDVAIGQIPPSCAITVDKTGDTLSKVGDPVNYTITVTNSAQTALYKDDITDSLLGNIVLNGVDQVNPLITSNNCNDVGKNPLQPGDSCTITATRTVQAGDPDPLPNTVTVSYNSKSDFTGTAIGDTDDHSVNLFQPDISITKDCTDLSKIGDTVDCTVVITNDSSDDSPDLVFDAISDTVQGDLTNAANYTSSTCGASFAWDESCTIEYSYTVPGDATDPYPNTVSVESHPDGFPNDIDAQASDSVNLFQPAVTVTKTGDTLSKIGDEVSYTIEVCNTGSADSPDLVMDSVIDDVLGDLSASYVLDLGPTECESHNFPYTVEAGDPDPLVNTVTVHYHPLNFPNDITDTDDHSLNLFQPSITFDKSGDTLSKIGDSVNYTISLNNTSSADTPDLDCTITDALLGVNENVTLASGDPEHVINTSRVVQAGDPDPLVNTANVSCNVTGFSNVLTDSDDHSVNLFQPAVTVTKTGDTLSKVGDDVTYTIEVCNTGSADSPDLMVESVFDDVLGVLTASYVLDLGPGDCESHDFTYTVQAGDPDPLVNVVEVHYHPDGFPNDISDTDDHSLNLFQPHVTVDKTGDTLSKQGDDVTYDFTITNDGSADSPALIMDSITDTVLGDLADDAPAACDSLALGASCSFSVVRTVLGGDPDPLVNTVTVHYHPDGFPNDITDSDSHSVDLFGPSINVDKTGDTLSKVGDDVNYTVTLSNNSSADSPDLDCVAEDSLLGIIYDGILPPGDTVINDSRTVQAGDPDPLLNTVTMTCNVAGFPNVLTDSDGHSVNLFQPAVTVTKTGDELSKIGDEVTYTIEVCNTGSADSPDLVMDSVIDDVLGDLSASYVLDLGPTECESHDFTYTVQEGDPDPLVNTVEVHYHPLNFPNDITDTDDHSLNLFQPSIQLEKTGDTLSKATDDVNYTITLNNTSSADTPDLECTITDALLAVNKNVTLASGGQDVTNTSRTVLETDPDPLVNTAEVSCSPAGFPNVLTDASGHTVNLFQPEVTVTKTGDTLSKAGDDVTYTIEVCNTGSADSPDLVMDSVIDDVLGDLSASYVLDLGPGDCESHDFPYTVQAGDSDPLVNTVEVHYHPDGFPNDITDTDDHSLNLFQPSIECDKTGDPLSKIGDPANYTIECRNTSSADTPPLDCTITDVLLGIDQNVTLASGENSVITTSREVQPGDPDPLVNTMGMTCNVRGFSNVLTVGESHSVNLFQPAVTVTKTGDTLSKIGDDVTYTIEVCNTGSADSPDLVMDSVIDDVLGDLSASYVLDLGPTECESHDFTYTVQAGDPDPLVNVVEVHYHPDGFPNDITDTDDHSLNLFQPGVEVSKACDDFAKFPDARDVNGLNDSDDIRCTISVTNTGSVDSPDLENGTISDTLCGDLLGTMNAACAPVSSTCTDTLATGGSCEIVYDFGGEFVGTTPDPISNTVEVHYNPDGFPNDITDSDTETIDVLHPNFEVTKDCLTEPVPIGGSAIFQVDFENTGDVALTVIADEDMTTLPGGILVPAGTSFSLPTATTKSFEVSIIATSGPVVENTVNATATLPASTGLTNELDRTATDECPVISGATRTPGFWQTHLTYTCHIFEDHLGGSIDLGWRTLDSCAEVFGMFWANNARESDGDRRPKLCQARVTGSFQLLAAILNTGLDNAAPVPIDPVTGLDIITAMQNALAGNDIHEIRRLAGLLDAYNNSGDDVAIIDFDGTPHGRANPKGAKAIADYTIADCTP